MWRFELQYNIWKQNPGLSSEPYNPFRLSLTAAVLFSLASVAEMRQRLLEQEKALNVQEMQRAAAYNAAAAAHAAVSQQHAAAAAAAAAAQAAAAAAAAAGGGAAGAAAAAG